MATTKKATAKKATKKSTPSAKKKVVEKKVVAPVKQSKKDVIKSHQVHTKDTGSAPVQIAILTEKINALTDHLKTHPKDKHSRRGLIGMVGKRRKLLRYLQMASVSAYAKVTQALKLRK